MRASNPFRLSVAAKRRSRGRVALAPTLLAALLPLTATPAAADGLCRDTGLADGPVVVSYGDVDTATGRRTCPRTEVALGGRAGAVIDTPDFYGGILAAGLLSGSYALSDRQEVFATVELVRYHWVVNAVIEGSSLTLGQTTAGYSHVTFLRDDLGGAATARLLLPTSPATGNVRVYGAEVGHSVTWRPLAALEVHGWLGADLTAGLSAGAALPRFGALLNAGVQYSPAEWFGLALDVNGRVGPLGYLAPALALRFRITRALGAELAATLPVAGEDRHTAIGALRFSYRL